MTVCRAGSTRFAHTGISCPEGVRWLRRAFFRSASAPASSGAVARLSHESSLPCVGSGLRALRRRSRDRRRHAVEPILRVRESEPGIAHAPELLARRVVGSSAFQGEAMSGVLAKMLGPARLEIRAARGICRRLPGVPAHRAPPLIDEFPGGQIGRVHGSHDEPPAGGTAVRPLRRRQLAVVLNHLRTLVTFELAAKMQRIKQDVHCAPPVCGGSAAASLCHWRLWCLCQ